MAYRHRLPLDDYELIDRYSRSTGRVLLTGTQALVRILLDQRDRDIADGLNTAGFVSGYRGSPLGGVDAELWKNKERLKQRRIEFLPAVNEDLAATAVLGSQQVETNARREVEGVFGLWYGKGPGIDRSGDALKHGNAYVLRRMAGFWSWPATIMVACHPRCRINPMSRSWPGSCRR